MMNDAVNMGMDNAEDEDEANKVYDQICGEIGIELDGEALGAVGKQKIAMGGQQEAAPAPVADDLESRLDQLKR